MSEGRKEGGQEGMKCTIRESRGARQRERRIRE
jgi:hypothetical protein